MGDSHFRKAAELCLANGERLLDDADWTNYSERPAGASFFLATIAQEEFAKAFLLFLVSRGTLVWNSLLHRATRDHACKQLLGLILSHLSPDWDEESRRWKEWLDENEERKGLFELYRSSKGESERERMWARIEEISNKHNSLPRSVTDAILLLRYEKIGRWESSTWVWEEEPAYDPHAKGLADGKLDREKQDALYVRLGREGHVVKTPAEVKHEDANAAMEIAGRMRDFVKYRLVRDNIADIEYEKIESVFKEVFANLSKEDTESLALTKTLRST